MSVNIKRVGAILLGILLSLPAFGATFNIFGPATGILKGSATSPITTSAVWADVTVLLSGTCNSSVFVRGDGTCVAVSLTSGVSGTLPVANGGTNLTAATDDNVMVGNGTTWQSKALTDCDSATSAVTYDVTTNAWGCNSITSISGAALTKTDDTNVTLTLGGSPTTALVNAASVTAGWTGTLAATRGGLGMSTVTDDTVAVANGTTWQSKALGDCDDTSGNHLNYDTGTNAFSCGTSSSSSVSGANPSASVGLSAVNGVATTYLRSDGAPALSQSIAPTWTGAHVFTQAQGSSRFDISGPNTGQGWATRYRDTTNNITRGFIGIGTDTATGAAITDFVLSPGTSGSIAIGTQNGAAVAGRFGPSGGLVMGSPTGGNQGNGTINATGLYINGTAVDAGSELVGTFTGTLTGVTSGTCSMKYRKVGNFVTLYVASGGCAGTSNANTLTMTGLPAAVQASLGAAVLGQCLDNGTGLLTSCAAIFTAASGTMTMAIAKASLTTGIITYDSSGWTGANSKGLSANFVIQYQTGT